MFFVAHAGEVHETAAASAGHWLAEWYVIIPLFIIAAAVITYAAYHFFKKSRGATVNFLMLELFLTGLLSYSSSAALSIFALSLGFGLALFSVLGSLSKS